MLLDAGAARRLFAGAAAARLATVTPAGHPHIVPVTFVLDSQPGRGDRVYTAVDHKPKTTTRLQRLRNIEAHPQVALLADHYADDWSRLWWVRADGAATVLGGATALDAAERAGRPGCSRRATRSTPPGRLARSSWFGWTAGLGGRRPAGGQARPWPGGGARRRAAPSTSAAP